ncbi:MAG: hypothetical protein Ct9H300mP6_15210 [Gammaproteobacteria bacterium]|nr:MAG: hypothetical protein Ct9H300mP6_15210 [Gammaproteobacteria bacterium]
MAWSSRYLPVKEEQPDIQEIKDRMMSVQALDAYRCLEENVLTSPDDGDIGSIFGWGFPPWSGGVFSYFDMVGLQSLLIVVMIIAIDLVKDLRSQIA